MDRLLIVGLGDIARRALPVARAEADRIIPPGLLSFMSESRRLVNRRLKEGLGIRLRYPTVFDGVSRGTAAPAWPALTQDLTPAA